MKKVAAQSGLPLSHLRKLLLMVCLGFFLAAMLSGCRGCRRDDQTAEEKKEEKEKDGKEKEEKKPKPRFEFLATHSQPVSDIRQRTMVKPGHWVTTSQQIRANLENFNGQMNSEIRDRYDRAVNLPNTPYHLTISRPVSLPKEQLKYFESLFFVPRGDGGKNKNMILKSGLQTRGGIEVASGGPINATMVPDWQYFFLVLSSAA